MAMAIRICICFLCLFFSGNILCNPADTPNAGRDPQQCLAAYLDRLAKQALQERQRTMEKISTPQEANSYQARVRSRLAGLVGKFPPSTPLHARVTGQIRRQGYRVEKVIFESRPRFFVTANLYVPESGSRPFPAVLGTAGHSFAGKASPIYQRAWINMARRGFVVLAFDPPGQGERLEYFDADLGRSRMGSPTQEHNMAGLQCLLTGDPIAQYFLWDGIRGFDYLCTRPEVDPGRIAVAGNSGGGTQAAYLAGMEPRLAAMISSCYMTSYRQLWTDPGPQDAEQVFPGFLKENLDLADWAIAAAPRPFLITSAIRDFFPIEGARAVHQELQRFWKILGQEDKAGFFEYDDTHGWSAPRRLAAYRWLEKQLLGKEGEEKEPDTAIEPEWNLWVTASGQLALSHPGETIHSLNLSRAETLQPQRKASASIPAEERRIRLIRLLGLNREQMADIETPCPTESLKEEKNTGFNRQSLLIQTEPGIWIQSTLYLPAKSAGPAPAILYSSDQGKMVNRAFQKDPEILAQSGYVVLDMEVRGTGSAAFLPGSSGYEGTYQGWMRSLMVGKTVVGMQCYDLLRGFTFLSRRKDVDPMRIAILGKGTVGIAALMASVLEPRIRKTAIESCLTSYMAMVRSRLHDGWTAAVLPGVLQETDLPDLAACLSPKPLWIVNPVSPTGILLPPVPAEKEYQSVTAAYQRQEKSSQFQYRYRLEEDTTVRAYQEWLAFDNPSAK